MGVFTYLIAHPPLLVTFYVVMYLLMLSMTTFPAFIPSKEKGKALYKTLNEGQKILLKVTGGPASVLANSRQQFVIKAGEIEIKSNQFSDFMFTGSGRISSSSYLEISGKSDVEVEIKSEYNLEITKFPGLDQKVAGVVFALLMGSIVGLAIWFTLSLLH